jgi:Cd2+/Zn2+-exporting ATPase
VENRRVIIIEDLHCSECADKLETSVRGIDGVAHAAMDYDAKTLTIEAGNGGDIDIIVSEADDIIKKLEPHVTVNEKLIAKTVKKVLLLVGLGCADCAARIEKEVGCLPGVVSAVVDFASQRLTIEVGGGYEKDAIIEKASDIARRIETGIDVVEEGRGKSEETGGISKGRIIRLAAGAVLFVIALIFKLPFWVGFGVFLASYIAVGGEVILKALKNILKGRVFDEYFLMSAATIGAFAIGEFPEGVAVMLFYQAGEFFQDIAVNRSRRSIAALMDIRPDYANLKVGNEVKKTAPGEVRVGDIIIVKPGERVPLDGRVTEGNSMLDTSALTGESVPREALAGSEVLSGSVNINGLLTIEVTKEFGESTVSRILDLVQNAGSRKARTENFITKFARYYTPIVVFVAAALAVVPPLVIRGAGFSEWIYRALLFLVVSCPCALVISIPLGFFGGIGGASKNGILIKGSNYLEALSSTDIVVFDKTGTLTKGVFKVTGVRAAGGIPEVDIIEYAAYAESYSGHPIARSIIDAYGRDIDKNEITEYDEIAGYGIAATVKGRKVLAGNARLMKKENVFFEDAPDAGTIVHIAVDGRYAGHIVISDEVKDDSKSAIQALRDMGVRKLVMLTGDSRAAGERIGTELGLDEIHAELLPDRKVEILESLHRQKSPKGTLIFVGDGINDAPVLARADVGIAMGGVGSDAAIEAADVVLMTDEPSKIVSAIKIAGRTRGIVWQNIIFSLVVKGIVLALGAGGVATMWEAVFADVGVALLAVLNAMRVMNTKKL